MRLDRVCKIRLIFVPSDPSSKVSATTFSVVDPLVTVCAGAADTGTAKVKLMITPKNRQTTFAISDRMLFVLISLTSFLMHKRRLSVRSEQ